jgi:hypothetical protein
MPKSLAKIAKGMRQRKIGPVEVLKFRMGNEFTFFAFY